MTYKKRDVRERFMSKVEYELNSGCWLWSAAVCSSGYGQLSVDNKSSLAHRLSYRLFRGDPGNLSVLHRCDTPLCVNPDHFFLGTSADNMADMVAKGRSLAGEASPNRRLTDDKVRKMREVYEAGDFENQTEMAKKFGVSQGVVSKVVLRRAWTHI